MPSSRRTLVLALVVALVALATPAPAQRLGIVQKTLREGTRAMDIGRQLSPTDHVDVQAYGAAALNLGRAYRSAGNLAQARRVLDDGLAILRPDSQGRHHLGTIA